jgi:hypothetical protein
MIERRKLMKAAFLRRGQLFRQRTALAKEQTAVFVGLGRSVALYHRSSTSYWNHKHIRCLYF